MSAGPSNETWLDPDQLGVRLILLGAEADDPALARALATGLVAAVVAEVEHVPGLRGRCRDTGTALLSRGSPAEADGVLVGDVDEVAAIRRAIGADAILGAAARFSRDAAMRAGEHGADWILFGKASGPVERAIALAAWWSELFVLPCAVSGRISAADVAEIAASRVDFAALSPDTWTDPARLDAIVAALRAA